MRHRPTGPTPTTSGDRTRARLLSGIGSGIEEIPEKPMYNMRHHTLIYAAAMTQ